MRSEIVSHEKKPGLQIHLSQEDRECLEVTVGH
jgi:hypothetical protein